MKVAQAIDSVIMSDTFYVAVAVTVCLFIGLLICGFLWWIIEARKSW